MLVPITYSRDTHADCLKLQRSQEIKDEGSADDQVITQLKLRRVAALDAEIRREQDFDAALGEGRC